MKNKKGSQRSKVENIGRELRVRAEKLVDQKRTAQSGQEPADSRSMLHELQVHQIELELQNQELQQAHLEAELARRKYFDLYDLAPVGYATFGPRGEILEINLTGARLLGEERRRLVNRRFQLFVVPGDIPLFNGFIEKVFSTGTRHICEVSLFKNGDQPAVVHIEGALAEPNEETEPQCQSVLLDITERKQADEALRNRESDLRLVMDAVPALIAAVDTDGRYRRVNRNYAQWFGSTVEAIQGLHMSDVLGEAQWGLIRSYVERVLAGETITYERQLLYQGGKSRWIRASYTPDLNEAGRIRGFVVHVIDIEERKKIEEAVRISEENYRRILETANEGVVIGTMDGKMNFINQTWADMLGYSKEEILGQVGLDFMDEDQKALVLDTRQKLQKGEKVSQEFKFRRKDGSELWTLCSSSMFQDKEGNFLGYLAMHADITDRKEAEEAIKAARDELEMRVQERTAELKKTNQYLAEQSRILESFFKDTITPLVFMDRDFNFIRVNEAYARACQRGVADFPGHNHFEFFPNEENETIFRQVVKTGTPYQALAKPFYFPDHPEWGVTYWDWILTPLADDQGETAFLVFSLVEVTDRQAAEEVVRNSERQLRSLANQLLYAQENERKRIARDMHDILGASLSALKYKMEDLVYNLPDRDPRQIGETLGSLIPIIQETIGEARRMQNDLRPPLLDDLGILPTLAWFSREFQKIYSRIAIEQRLEVREEDVPDLLKVVIFRITQEALNNIGKHARATQAGIYLSREQDRLKLVIRDNGAGFEYQRLPESAKQSTGMGLSSMKERAKLSGGFFSLESHPGQGTVIAVFWPLKKRTGKKAE